MSDIDDAVEEIEEAPFIDAALVAYAIIRLARAQEQVAYQLKCLVTGDAATQMGALEFLSGIYKRRS